MKAPISVFLLAFLFISTESLAEPTIRGSSLCRRLIQFDIDPQNTNSAFTITANSREVLSNGTLNIVLKARFDAFQIFFLIGVDTYAPRYANPLGTFVVGTDNSSTVFSCLGGINNAIRNLDSLPKRNATVNWIPPSNFSGYVVFKATFIWNRNDRQVAKSRNIRVRQISSSTSASPITTVGTTFSTPTSNSSTVSTSYSQMTTLPEKNSTKPASANSTTEPSRRCESSRNSFSILTIAVSVSFLFLLM